MVKTDKKLIVLQTSWLCTKRKGEYYISSMHALYLDYIVKRYEQVVLICPVLDYDGHSSLGTALSYDNLTVEELPYFSGYINAVKHAFSYFKAIKKWSNADLFYCRVPDPFAWMPRLVFRKTCKMHYVGDSFDVITNNVTWSALKKSIVKTFYYPEYFLTLLASRSSEVYTNGFHLSEKMKFWGIKSTPVISSTIRSCELVKEKKVVNPDLVRLIYIGYLRNAKGIDTICELIGRLEAKSINYKFEVVGEGEMRPHLEKIVSDLQLQERVCLRGYVDDREQIKKYLLDSDLFIFPSLSEGTPRVLLEAASCNVPIASTPVGSAPYIFKDRFSIRFFKFNSADELLGIITDWFQERDQFDKISDNAFNLVQSNYTIEKFLGRVFE